MSAVNNSTSSNNTNSISSEAEAIIEKDLSFATQEIEKFSKMLAMRYDELDYYSWMMNLYSRIFTMEEIADQLHQETLENAQAIFKIFQIAKKSFASALKFRNVSIPLYVVLKAFSSKLLPPVTTDRNLLMEMAINSVESHYPMIGTDAESIHAQTSILQEDMKDSFLHFLKDADFKAELIARCPEYKDVLKLFEDEDLQYRTIVYCLTAPEDQVHESFQGIRNDPAISALYQELLQLPCFGNEESGNNNGGATFDTPLLKIISEYGVDTKALFTKYFGSNKE